MMAAAGLSCAVAACHDGARDAGRGATAWPVDERHNYNLELKSRYGAANSLPVFDFQLSAVMTLVPVRRSGNDVEFLLTLEQPKLSARQTGQGVPSVDAITGDLQKPYAFVLTNGRWTSSRIARGANPLAVGILRMLASALQKADEHGEKHWEASENDATGRYLAAYERVSPALLRKTKVRYVDWSASTSSSPAIVGPMRPPSVKQSRVELQGAGGPESVVLDETLVTEVAPGTALESVTSLVLKQLSTQKVVLSDAEVSQRLADAVQLPADQPYTAAGVQATGDLDRAKVADLSFPEIIAGLEAQAKARDRGKSQPSPEQQIADQKWMGEEARFFSALNATLRQKPEMLRQVDYLIRRASPARDALISSLGAAGTTDSQALLLKLMADKTLPEEARNACGWSLVRTPNPSPVAIRGVEQTLDDPNWHRLGVYGLGTFARLLREAGNDREAKRLVEVLASRLRTADSVQEKVDLLLGLSNSGAPELFDLALPWILDSSPDLRGAAVTALRLIQRSDVDRILTERLQADDEKAVRLAALGALGNRTPSEPIAQVLTQVSLRDTSKKVRYEAVHLMVDWIDKVPSLRSALEKVSQGESEETIRTVAAAALAAPRKG